MTATYRILLADDSVTVRRLLSETLSNDPSLEVVHAARDGREAVTQFSLVQPDVVVLDVEMPIMDGIEAVTAIRKIDAHVPIIMFSSLTVRGGDATLDALSAGATDYVSRPSRVGHLQEAIAHIRHELIPMILHWGKWKHDDRHAPIPFPANMRLERQPAVSLRREPLTAGPKVVTKNLPAEIIAIGVSTGGPNALADVLKLIPKQFPIPILVAQHMPPLFTGLLADRLNQVCPLPVAEATDGAILDGSHVWIAPGDRHLIVEKQGLSRVLRLTRAAPVNSCRPSADVLFRSVADTYGEAAIGVVLTGMGQDGLEGSRLIRSRGGKIIVQDQATSVVWGMPRAVAEAGLADRILPLGNIGTELSHLAQKGRPLPALVK